MPPMHAATSAIIAAVLIVSTTPALAINKCKIDGRTVFQDAPCPDGTGGAITVRPASGAAPAAPEPAQTQEASESLAPSAPADTDDMRTRAAALEKERKGRELDHKIKIVQQKIKQLEDDQAAEIAALKRKKARANNNLAGATWESSISEEQKAVAMKYESRMANERAKIERLEAERGRL